MTPADLEARLVEVMDETLADLFPDNPRKEVTAIMTDGVLHVLARAIIDYLTALHGEGDPLG